MGKIRSVSFFFYFNFEHAVCTLATYASHSIKVLVSEMARRYALCEVGNGFLNVMYTNYSVRDVTAINCILKFIEHSWVMVNFIRRRNYSGSSV